KLRMRKRTISKHAKIAFPFLHCVALKNDLRISNESLKRQASLMMTSRWIDESAASIARWRTDMFADFEYEDARKVLVRYFPESQVPNRRTIVVIDDNDDNRFVFRTFLEDKYEIEEFADGQKALHGLKEMRAHVIFLDISLPGLDG